MGGSWGVGGWGVGVDSGSSVDIWRVRGTWNRRYV